jgi:hypothetical protein
MRRNRALSCVVLALAMSGCAGKSEPATSSPEPQTPGPSAAVTSPGAATSQTALPSPTAPAVDQTIRITYAGGKVSGVGSLVKVKLNSSVALVVTSDVADEVHFHGYDKSADVAKGGTVTKVFKPTLHGR